MRYLEEGEFEAPTSCEPRCGPQPLRERSCRFSAASSLKNKGVQLMLDAVVDYLPSPLDVPPMIAFIPGTDQEVERHADDKEPLAALAFKIQSTRTLANSPTSASTPAF